jgi:methyltransferase (TIGR00027 family)
LRESRRAVYLLTKRHAYQLEPDRRLKAERASKTAMMVAYMRAVADLGASHVRDFRDPTARAFLDDRWMRRLDKIESKLHSAPEGMTMAFARVSADLMALRTSTIDDAVRAAIARGTRQLVILGAGLDGRAWRMHELEGVRVFEVDHPATQAFKRRHLDKLPRAIAEVTFVSIDFERESLEVALTGAGHDSLQPTCWIWEGVVMYLTRDVMRSTLATIAARSAEGSTVIVNYHTSMRSPLYRLFLRLLGEPVKSKWSSEEIAAEFRATGFRVVEDTNAEDWARRYAAGTVDVKVGRIMRIVVAERAIP